MTKQIPDRLIPDVVDAVLETMFFCAVLGPAEPATGGEILEARVAFRGRLSGTLGVCLSESSSRLLAAGFLGEDEESLTDAQPGQVVCELANMLCGSLVSKLESEESFDLASPELLPCGNETVAGSGASPVARQSFELEGGILTVTLHLESAA
ncbi:MAG TPA: chemotaxis protein CheX [Candidatus Sulfopaludibacter sp.]|jgi:CheY-specific phosphatase CheX|nr:chemotaxis protein CheX [Candidatus Sulfopaludibacter sp.]